MKLVKENNIKNWDMKVTCRGCHSQFFINDDDIAYEAGDEITEPLWHFTCSLCKYQTDLHWDANDMPPDIILDNARKRYYQKPLREKLARRNNFPVIILIGISVIVVAILFLFGK